MSPATNTRAAGVAAAALGGIGVALQSKINGELGGQLSDGFAAALISFGSGLVVITMVTLFQPAARDGFAKLRYAIRRRELRAYQCCGGVCGAVLVASQGLTVTVLGVAIFTVAVVGGQTIASLVVDRLGVGPAGPQRLTVARIAGAGIAIVAVLIAVGNHIANPSSALIAVLPAIAGAGSAWQQAVNGRVRSAAHSVVTATQINFIMGTSALAIAFAVDLVVRGLPHGHLPANPVYYLGGCLGVMFIAIAAAVVHEIGVLLLGLSMVAGQLIGALGVDVVAPGSEGRPDLNTLVGVALTLVAVGVASLRPRRASDAEQEVSVG